MRFPEFAEFTEFLFYLKKTPIEIPYLDRFTESSKFYEDIIVRELFTFLMKITHIMSVHGKILFKSILEIWKYGSHSRFLFLSNSVRDPNG